VRQRGARSRATSELALQRDPWYTRARVNILTRHLIGVTVVALFANVVGDLWNWGVGVVGPIGDVSIYWLLLALALKTAESALR
jgi:hypothetical protein